jgi:hypothetical protein
LGVILPSVFASVLATMLIDWKWPWFLQPIKAAFEIPFGWLAALCNWLGATTPVYRWWYGTVIVLLALSLGWHAYRKIRALRIESDPRRYGRDSIFELVWRWNYIDSNFTIAGLTPFCPQCDRTMEWRDASYNAIDTSGTYGYFTCREGCTDVAIRQLIHEFKKVVGDEIFLRLRNGSWKLAFERARREQA